MKVVAHWQGLNSTPRWKLCSNNIIWTVLADPRYRHLFGWRVSIFFKTIHTYRNVCSIEMHKPDQKCTDLIEATANALSMGAVAIMLMAVQRDNLELSVKQAIRL